jgi:hypothetical protein
MGGVVTKPPGGGATDCFGVRITPFSGRQWYASTGRGTSLGKPLEVAFSSSFGVFRTNDIIYHILTREKDLSHDSKSLTTLRI